MFLHYFQIFIIYIFKHCWRHSCGFCPQVPIIMIFLHVCNLVSWLTSLLELGQYRDISSSVRDIFLKFVGDIPGMFALKLQIYLIFFISFSLLVGLLPH